MTDATTASTADSAAAADAAKSDEQVWADLEKDEAKAEPADKGDGKPADGEKTEADGKAAAVADGKPAEIEDTSKVEGTDKSAPKAEDDIWANAPEPLRAAHEATLKERDEATTARKRAEGTVSGLQRKVNELAKAPAKAATEGDAKMILDSPEYKKAKEDYPEVFESVDKAFKALVAKVDTIAGKTDAVTTKNHLDEQARIVAAVHPDHGQIAGSKAFADWYETQPAYVKSAVERNASAVVNGDEVAALMSQFKRETGWKPTQPPVANSTGKQKPAEDTRRKVQLESAGTPKGKSTQVKADGLPDDDPVAIWNDFDRRGL